MQLTFTEFCKKAVTLSPPTPAASAPIQRTGFYGNFVSRHAKLGGPTHFACATLHTTAFPKPLNPTNPFASAPEHSANARQSHPPVLAPLTHALSLKYDVPFAECGLCCVQLPSDVASLPAALTALDLQLGPGDQPRFVFLCAETTVPAPVLCKPAVPTHVRAAKLLVFGVYTPHTREIASLKSMSELRAAPSAARKRTLHDVYDPSSMSIGDMVDMDCRSNTSIYNADGRCWLFDEVPSGARAAPGYRVVRMDDDDDAQLGVPIAQFKQDAADGRFMTVCANGSGADSTASPSEAGSSSMHAADADADADASRHSSASSSAPARSVQIEQRSGIPAPIVARIESEIRAMFGGSAATLRMEHLAQQANIRLSCLLSMYRDGSRTCGIDDAWTTYRDTEREALSLRRVVIGEWLSLFWKSNDEVTARWNAGLAAFAQADAAEKPAIVAGLTQIKAEEAMLFHEPTSQHALMIVVFLLRRRLPWFPQWAAHMEAELFKARLIACDLPAAAVLDTMLAAEAFMHSYRGYKQGTSAGLFARGSDGEIDEVLWSRRLGEIRIVDGRSEAHAAYSGYAWCPNGIFSQTYELDRPPEAARGAARGSRYKKPLCAPIVDGLSAESVVAPAKLVDTMMSGAHARDMGVVSIPLDLWMRMAQFRLGDGEYSDVDAQGVQCKLVSELHLRALACRAVRLAHATLFTSALGNSVADDEQIRTWWGVHRPAVLGMQRCAPGAGDAGDCADVSGRELVTPVSAGSTLLRGSTGAAPTIVHAIVEMDRSMQKTRLDHQRTLALRTTARYTSALDAVNVAAAVPDIEDLYTKRVLPPCAALVMKQLYERKRIGNAQLSIVVPLLVTLGYSDIPAHMSAVFAQEAGVPQAQRVSKAAPRGRREVEREVKYMADGVERALLGRAETGEACGFAGYGCNGLQTNPPEKKLALKTHAGCPFVTRLHSTLADDLAALLGDTEEARGVAAVVDVAKRDASAACAAFMALALAAGAAPDFGGSPANYTRTAVKLLGS